MWPASQKTPIIGRGWPRPEMAQSLTWGWLGGLAQATKVPHSALPLSSMYSRPVLPKCVA